MHAGWLAWNWQGQRSWNWSALTPRCAVIRPNRLLRALRDPTVRAPGSQRVRAGDTLARLGDPRFRARCLVSAGRAAAGVCGDTGRSVLDGECATGPGGL